MENFEVRGHWWLPERPDHKVAGVLKFSAEHGAELELFGSLRSLLDLGDRTERDGVTQVEMTDNALELSARYPRVLGQADGKRFTLDDCFATHTSWAIFGGPSSQVLNVGRVLRGAFFETGEPIEASGVSFAVAYLNYWLTETGIVEKWNFSETGGPLAEGIPEFRLEAFAKPDRKVTIADGRTLTLQHRVGISGDRIAQRSITQSFDWRIDYSGGKISVEDVLDWASDLQDLISICSLEPAGFEFVQLWHPDVFHQSSEGREIPAPIDMFARWNVRSEESSKERRPDFLFDFHDFGEMEGLRRWMEVAAEHRSSLGRVTATRYARGMFASDRLLNCAAALEGLDRTITALSNSKFKTRLTRCSSLAGEPFLELVGDVARWAEAVRLDRDDVAHHFGRRTRSSSITTFYLWESLYFLYVLCPTIVR
jgi:ApeA N-terminal domain 1